VINKLSFVV